MEIETLIVVPYMLVKTLLHPIAISIFSSSSSSVYYRLKEPFDPVILQTKRVTSSSYCAIYSCIPAKSLLHLMDTQAIKNEPSVWFSLNVAFNTLFIVYSVCWRHYCTVFLLLCDLLSSFCHPIVSDRFDYMVQERLCCIKSNYHLLGNCLFIAQSREAKRHLSL